MVKKAILILELIEEATNTPNDQIEKEILTDSQIPWCAKINKVEIYTPSTTEPYTNHPNNAQN